MKCVTAHGLTNQAVMEEFAYRWRQKMQNVLVCPAVLARALSDIFFK